MYKFLIAIISISFIVSGCNKYEDGPLLSLRSKQERLINTWAYNLVLRNGANVTFGTVDGAINYAASEIGFNDENRFSDIFYQDSIYVQRDGSWIFNDKKKEVHLTYDDNGEMRTLRINRLKEKDLHLEEDFDNNLYEYELLPNR